MMPLLKRMKTAIRDSIIKSIKRHFMEGFLNRLTHSWKTLVDSLAIIFPSCPNASRSKPDVKQDNLIWHGLFEAA